MPRMCILSILVIRDPHLQKTILQMIKLMLFNLLKVTISSWKSRSCPEKKKKKKIMEVRLWLNRLRTQYSIPEDAVQSLALLTGLSIKRCHKLRCPSQMQLRSSVAVAVA